MTNLTKIFAVSVLAASMSCASKSPAPAPAAAAVDSGTPAPTVSAYPDGPYGATAGKILADREMTGYFRVESTGLASAAPLQAPLKFSDIRAAALDPSGAPVKYALMHLSAYWCPICKATIEDLISQYPHFSAKAIFVDLMVEGVTPSDTVTMTNMTTWISSEKVPFTTAMDPVGVSFGLKTALGLKDTTFLIELETMSVILKTGDYQAALDKLKTL